MTTSLVLAEIVWTLESYYHLSKDNIQSKILAILNTPGLIVEQDAIILRAILLYVEKNVDFIDAFNAAWMIDHGLKTVYTFELRHFSRFEDLQAMFP